VDCQVLPWGPKRSRLWKVGEPEKQGRPKEKKTKKKKKKKGGEGGGGGGGEKKKNKKGEGLSGV